MTESVRLPSGDFFVDREKEKAQFDKVLHDPQTPPILVLYGSSGMGKTLMIDRIQHECNMNQMRVARVDFSSTRAPNYDYVQVCRQMRDQWGSEMFGPFTDKLNWCTTLGYEPVVSWRLGDGQSFEDVSWLRAPCDDPTAPKVRDRFDPLRPTLRGLGAKVDLALTHQFLSDAVRLVADKQSPIVCLFDDVDKTDPTMRKWFWDFLLANFPEANEARIVAVVAVNERPQADLNYVPVQINTLSRESVERYGKEYGINSYRSLITLWRLSEYGCPHQLAWALNATLEIEKLLASENEAKMERSLLAQLDAHRGNLHYLLERASKFGALNVPLNLKNEIDAEKEEIARLEAELRRLRSGR